MAASTRDEFDDFFDNDEPEDVVDTKPDGRLLRVPLNRIAPNLVNPRTDFGTAEQLEDFGRSLKRRQLQALPVVTRKAYLKLWPDHEDRIGQVDVVIVSGERRYRGATAVNLAGLECVINDDFATSRKTFLDAVVSENIDRANFDPVEEAYAVQALVDAFGTARAVAQHYERADGWVSQRRVLLELAPGVQSLVRRRDMPLEPARKLGKLTKDHGWGESEQLEWWAAQQVQRAIVSQEKKAARKERAKEPVPAGGEGQSFTAVKTGPPPQPLPSARVEQPQPPAASPKSPASPVQQPPVVDTPDGVPEPRPETAEPGALSKPVIKMPWSDGAAAMDIVFEKVSEEERPRLLARYLHHLGGADEFAGELSAASSSEYCKQLAESLLARL